METITEKKNTLKAGRSTKEMKMSVVRGVATRNYKLPTMEGVHV